MSLVPSTISMPLLQVLATPSEGWIIYKGRYKVKLRVGSDVISDRIPFAYQFSPPTSQRNYPIIYIIAGPGVSIQLEGFPVLRPLTSENTIPHVEIIRVQSLNQVPPIGTQFNPPDYTGMKAVETPSERSEQQARQGFGLPPLPPDIVLHKRGNGLDIVQVSSKQVLRIRAPNLRGDTAFAYEVTPERLIRGSSRQRVVVKLVKTRSVEVTLHMPFVDLRESGHGLLFGIVPIVYEVDNVRDVPTQGLPIPEKGRKVNVKREMQESLTRIIKTTALDAAVGFIPVVGDLVDIAELTYGIFTGYDKWGRPLSTGDLVLMGIGTLLPLVGSGVVKGVVHIGKAFNRDPQEVADLVRAAQNLSNAERKNIEDWTDLIRRGEQIPEAEVNTAVSIVKKIDAAVAGQPKQLPAPPPAVTPPPSRPVAGFARKPEPPPPPAVTPPPSRPVAGFARKPEQPPPPAVTPPPSRPVAGFARKPEPPPPPAVTPPPSRPVAGFARKPEPPPPPGPAPQGPPVVTQMPPARVIPSSPSGQGVIGQRRNQPARATAGKPPPGGEPEPNLPAQPKPQPAGSTETSPHAPISRAELEGKIDLNNIPLPEDLRGLGLQRFGSNFIGWGSGVEGAKALILRIQADLPEIREHFKRWRDVGFTPAMSRAVAKEYEGQASGRRL